MSYHILLKYFTLSSTSYHFKVTCLERYDPRTTVRIAKICPQTYAAVL